MSRPRVFSVTTEEHFAAHFADDEVKDAAATPASELMPRVQAPDGNRAITGILGLPPRGVTDRMVAGVRITASPQILQVMEEEVPTNRLRRSANRRVAAHTQGKEHTPQGIGNLPGPRGSRREELPVEFRNRRRPDLPLGVTGGASVAEGFVCLDPGIKEHGAEHLRRIALRAVILQCYGEILHCL